MSKNTKETVRENVNYLNSTLNPIFEQLTLQILVKKPKDVVDFMIGWLLDNADGYNTPTVKKLMTSSSNNHPAQPQQEAARADGARMSKRMSQVLASRAEPKGVGFKEAEGKKDDKKVKIEEVVTSASEDDEDEDMEPLPAKPVAGKKGPRQSVSAEVFGRINKRGTYKPKVVPKSKQQKEKIRIRLNQNFMFSELDEKEKEIIIDVMEEMEFNAGEYVIRQGDHGNELYVVDAGTLECTKTFSEGAAPRLLKTYAPGDSFGELALLYNAPRAATIRAKTNSVLYALDRECFNHIVKTATMKRREHYDKVLQKVSLLQTIDSYERSQIADVVKTIKFKKGDYIITQGENGNTFYMVEEGTAVATKQTQSGREEQVFSYQAGDYFGELALLKDAPRAANIIATSDVSLVALDRDSFKRILGPLDEILTRNTDRYQN